MFLESMPTMYLNLWKSEGRRGRDRDVRCIPRFLAAAVILGSDSSPSW